MDSTEDTVTRNRAVHPRRTPDRPQVGDELLPKLYAAAAAAVLIATIVLIVLLTA